MKKIKPQTVATDQGGIIDFMSVKKNVVGGNPTCFKAFFKKTFGKLFEDKDMFQRNSPLGVFPNVVPMVATKFWRNLKTKI